MVILADSHPPHKPPPPKIFSRCIPMTYFFLGTLGTLRLAWKVAVVMTVKIKSLEKMLPVQGVVVSTLKKKKNVVSTLKKKKSLHDLFILNWPTFDQSRVCTNLLWALWLWLSWHHFWRDTGDTQMVQTQNLCDYLKPETTAGKGPEGLVKEAYSEQGRRFLPYWLEQKF